MGLLNGVNVFGIATTFQPSIDATAQQINAFFGVNGVQAVHGGQRGMSILVSGVFFGPTPESVIAQEGILLSYRDGISRRLDDNLGRVYPSVVFDGPYQTWEHGVKPAFLPYGGVGGWAMAYKAVFRELGG